MGKSTTVYEALDRCLADGEMVAVATIVRRKGSTPREVGAKMLIRANGDTDGTVGGGCGEADVWRAALDVMEDREPRMVLVDLTEEIAMNTDGVCGGTMEIFVEPWVPDDVGQEAGGSQRRLASGLLEAAASKRPAVLATVVASHGSLTSALGSRLLVVDGFEEGGDIGGPWLRERVLADVAEVMAEGHSCVRTYALGPEDSPDPSPLPEGEGALVAPVGTASVYFELALPKPVLVIVGAGHIAVPVADVGRLLDFDVVVIDDRPSFANRSRFPTADRIVVDDFESALDRLPITPSTFVVLVTRGHVHDVRSLRKIVEWPAAYIGMIGSRRRVFAVFKLLHEEGVSIEALLRVHAPIGLDIETETPGEIAVSIGAELVKARRGGGASSRSDRMREQHRASLLKDEERWLVSR